MKFTSTVCHNITVTCLWCSNRPRGSPRPEWKLQVLCFRVGERKWNRQQQQQQQQPTNVNHTINNQQMSTTQSTTNKRQPHSQQQRHKINQQATNNYLIIDFNMNIITIMTIVINISDMLSHNHQDSKLLLWVSLGQWGRPLLNCTSLKHQMQSWNWNTTSGKVLPCICKPRLQDCNTTCCKLQPILKVVGRSCSQIAESNETQVWNKYRLIFAKTIRCFWKRASISWFTSTHFKSKYAMSWVLTHQILANEVSQADLKRNSGDSWYSETRSPTWWVQDFAFNYPRP